VSFPGYPQKHFGAMPYRGGPVAHPQATFPGYPVMPPRSGGGEAAITTLLVIPLLVFVFLDELLPLLMPDLDVFGTSGWWATGWAIAIGVYFVFLVLVRGRNAGRRVGAGLLALLVAVIYAGPALWAQLTGQFHWLLWNGLAATRLSVVIVLAVITWGIARRRSALWLVGLVPTLLLGGLWMWARDNLAHSWSPDEGKFLALVASYYGVILVGALCCWAFDAMGSGGRARHPVAMNPAMPMAPGQYPGVVQQMYPQQGSGGFGYPPSGPAPGRGSGYNPMAR